MESIKYTCDECGVEKRESNHWFRLFTTKTNNLPDTVFVASTWNIAELPDTEIFKEQHLCSESCLLKKISSLVQKREG